MQKQLGKFTFTLDVKAALKRLVAPHKKIADAMSEDDKDAAWIFRYVGLLGCIGGSIVCGLMIHSVLSLYANSHWVWATVLAVPTLYLSSISLFCILIMATATGAIIYFVLFEGIFKIQRTKSVKKPTDAELMSRLTIQNKRVVQWALKNYDHMTVKEAVEDIDDLNEYLIERALDSVEDKNYAIGRDIKTR